VTSGCKIIPRIQRLSGGVLWKTATFRDSKILRSIQQSHVRYLYICHNYFPRSPQVRWWKSIPHFWVDRFFFVFLTTIVSIISDRCEFSLRLKMDFGMKPTLNYTCYSQLQKHIHNHAKLPMQPYMNINHINRKKYRPGGRSEEFRLHYDNIQLYKSIADWLS
jgi:hypothetical protein